MYIWTNHPGLSLPSQWKWSIESVCWPDRKFLWLFYVSWSVLYGFYEAIDLMLLFCPISQQYVDVLGTLNCLELDWMFVPGQANDIQWITEFYHILE